MYALPEVPPVRTTARSMLRLMVKSPAVVKKW
jgi:hypothetical protein